MSKRKQFSVSIKNQSKKIQKRGIGYSGNNRVFSAQLLLIDLGISVNDISSLSDQQIGSMFELHTVVAADSYIGYSDNSIRGEAIAIVLTCT